MQKWIVVGALITFEGYQLLEDPDAVRLVQTKTGQILNLPRHSRSPPLPALKSMVSEALSLNL